MRAVEEALASSGHLLAAGEQYIAQSFLHLPAPAASLYARLHGRRDQVFRRDSLSYTEIPDPELACDHLVEAGFAWRGEQVLPTVRLAGALSVDELRAACRKLGRPVSGRKAALLERLADEQARPAVARATVKLRHRALFQRLARLFLGSRHGDLSRLVLARMELRRYPSYTPTCGLGLFPHRAALLAWEDGLRLDAALSVMDPPARRKARSELVDRDLALVESQPRPPPWRSRFSARQMAAERLLKAARQWEREGRHGAAIALYERTLAAGVDQPGEVLKRQAIALGADGRPAQGARLCQQALAQVDEVTRIGLARTGRRLARAAKLGWAPLPPLTRPATRQIHLEMAPTRSHRPLWRSPDGNTTLEAALVSQLAAIGRVAIHAEGLLWRTLFGLLFDDLIFAPVPGMLPTPYHTHPLDLGGPEFVARRQPQVSQRLAEISAGGAPARIARCWTERRGQAIAGLCWTRFPLPLLQRVATDLGGAALSAVLGVVANAWRLSPRGLPDLVVLAGPQVRLRSALPGRIPAHALLAEVKGPGDQLSDAQRAWLDRLLRAGVPTQLWRVAPVQHP